MASKKKNSLVMLIIVAVLAVAIIVSLVLLILQRTGLEAIQINPTFADTELDVNMDYIISVNTDPNGTNIKKFEYKADSTSVTFEYKDDGTAILHTTGEGAVTIYVKKGSIESNKLSFQIVDKAAQAAAEQAAAEAAAEQERLQAEAEAQAQAEAEAAAAAEVKYIKAIKDNINIRSNASTDGEILGKAKLGDTFEVINDDGSWTEFKYGDKSGFMRNDMIQLVEEGAEVTTTQPTEEKPKEEAKQEEEKKEKTPEEKAAEEAKKAEDAAKKAAEEQQKQLEEAAAQAQAAAAAAAAAGVTINCADGPHTFRPDQANFIKGFWSYTGAWEEMAHKHTYEELLLVCEVEGHISR